MTVSKAVALSVALWCGWSVHPVHAQQAPATQMPARLGAVLPHPDIDDPQPFQSPVGDLDLRQALALALVHHPQMAAFSWQMRATEAAQLQAAAWPNPGLGLEVENVAGSGIYEGLDLAETTLGLSQSFLLGGKRGKRVDQARGQARVTQWEYEVARVRLYTSTAEAYYDVLAAQARRELADKILELARNLEEAVAQRIGAGGTLALEQNRARAITGTSVIETQVAERELQAARAGLAAQWGEQQPGFTRATGDLEAVPEGLPSLEVLLERTQHNPLLAQWAAEIERRGAIVALRKADRVPDLDLGFGVRHDNAVDDLSLVFALQAPLTLWDRRGGAIGEARAHVEQARLQQSLAHVDLQRDVAVVYHSLVGAHDELRGLRDGVLPEAGEAATRSGAAYDAGAIGLTDVLDIQRTFYRMRLRYVDALRRFHTRAVQLEGLLGVPIVEWSSSSANPGPQGGQP